MKLVVVGVNDKSRLGPKIWINRKAFFAQIAAIIIAFDFGRYLKARVKQVMNCAG